MIRQHVTAPARSGDRLLPLAAILAVLGVAVFIGLGRVPLVRVSLAPAFILSAVAAALAVAITLSRIEYGILMLPVIAVTVPYAMATGTASALVASLLFAAVLVCAVLVRAVVARRLTFVRSPLNAPLLGFVLTAVLSTFHSHSTQDPLVYFPPSWAQIQAGGLSVFVLSATTLLVVLNAFRELRWVRRLTWVYIGVATVAVLAYLVQDRNDVSWMRIGGLFSLWVVALALGQALFNTELSAWKRAGLVALAGVWLHRRFFLETEWLSGWVPLCIAVLVLTWLRSRRLFLAVLLVGGIIGWQSYDTIFTEQVTGSESAGNFLRLDLWLQNFEVTKNHLWLGTGPAGYAPYYASYVPDRAISTHSTYLDVIAQTGLIGAGFFLWFLVAMFRVAFDVRRQWPRGFGAGFANGALAGLVGMMVGMALGDWVIPFVYNQSIAGFRYTVHSWIVLGALASMQQIARVAASTADGGDGGDGDDVGDASD